MPAAFPPSTSDLLNELVQTMDWLYEKSRTPHLIYTLIGITAFSYRRIQESRENTVLPPLHITPRLIRSNIFCFVLGAAIVTLASIHIFLVVGTESVRSLMNDPDIWTKNERAGSLADSFEVDLATDVDMWLTVLATFCMATGFVMSTTAWSHRYRPMDRPDLKIPWSGDTIQFVIYMLATAGISAYAGIWATWLEWGDQQLNSCKPFEKDYQGRTIQITRCTEEALACHMLPRHGIPERYTRTFCTKAKARRFIILGIMICSFAQLVICLRWVSKRRERRQNDMLAMQRSTEKIPGKSDGEAQLQHYKLEN